MPAACAPSPGSTGTRSRRSSSITPRAAHARRPRLDYESHATGLDRNEWARCWSPPVSAYRAGITKPVGPHTLRHPFITAALDAGASLRDVQDAASHADPRTTMRYDRARGSLDRHATYIVAAYVAGTAR